MTAVQRRIAGPTHAEDPVDAAARRLYDAEVALHIARQTGVDKWICAAYDRLHIAILEHTAALGRDRTGTAGGKSPGTRQGTCEILRMPCSELEQAGPVA